MNEEVVVKNIKDIYERKQKAVVALCKYYAKLVIQDFKKEQNNNKYWTNQSSFAKDLMFTRQYKEDEVIGFLMAHGVRYGVSLELANNKKHAAIEPTIRKFLPDFKKDLKKIYGD